MPKSTMCGIGMELFSFLVPIISQAEVLSIGLGASALSLLYVRRFELPCGTNGWSFLGSFCIN